MAKSKISPCYKALAVLQTKTDGPEPHTARERKLGLGQHVTGSGAVPFGRLQ